MTAPEISVIITSKNEEKNIAACLKSIKEQSLPEKLVEIIVIDNASTDRTKELARKYTELVFDRGPERSAQRNFGVSKARAAVIIYLDADMTLSRGLLEEVLERFRHDKDIAALYIPEVVVGDSFFSRVRNFERSFYNATVIDCVRPIRRSIFEAVGGFDENLTGPEDWDFDKKIRAAGKVNITTAVLYHDEGEFNLRKYMKKKAYYSGSMDDYIAKWGKDDPDVRRQLGAYYRLVGVFVEDGKWKKLIISPHLTVGMLFLRFCVGMCYLFRKTR